MQQHAVQCLNRRIACRGHAATKEMALAVSLSLSLSVYMCVRICVYVCILVHL